MYGSDATLRDMVRSDPINIPAKTAPITRPRDILGRCKVTLNWLVWQVAREEVDPRDAAWSMCPPVDVLSSGWLKLIGHTELVFRNWLNFYRECGWDEPQSEMVKHEIRKIWNLKGDTPCHLPQKR